MARLLLLRARHPPGRRCRRLKRRNEKLARKNKQQSWAGALCEGVGGVGSARFGAAAKLTTSSSSPAHHNHSRAASSKPGSRAPSAGRKSSRRLALMINRRREITPLCSRSPRRDLAWLSGKKVRPGSGVRTSKLRPTVSGPS